MAIGKRKVKTYCCETDMMEFFAMLRFPNKARYWFALCGALKTGWEKLTRPVRFFLKQVGIFIFPALNDITPAKLISAWGIIYVSQVNTIITRIGNNLAWVKIIITWVINNITLILKYVSMVNIIILRGKSNFPPKTHISREIS